MASFLSARNTRTDGYGGAREERVRLPLDVFRAVRTAVSPGNLRMQVYPGRLYTLAVSSTSWTTADIHFDVPAGFTLDDYFDARLVTTPFGLYDCDVPCDASVAIVVSHVDAARDVTRELEEVHVAIDGGPARSRIVRAPDEKRES